MALKVLVRQNAFPVSPGCSVRSTLSQSIVPNGMSLKIIFVISRQLPFTQNP
jgi:hypothetical protein